MLTKVLDTSFQEGMIAGTKRAVDVNSEDVIVEEHEPFLRNIHSLNRYVSISFYDTKLKKQHFVAKREVK